MVELSLDSRVEIADDVWMPRLGLGTYKSAPGREVHHSVEVALKHGYRGIDTAALYGNEESVGKAIRESGIARDEIFLATKVWNTDQGYKSTHAAFAGSVMRLGVEYVDLYLVHWPVLEHMPGTWRAMEELLADGKTRSIGVCNHLPHHLADLFQVANVRPAIDQVEFHPWLQQPSLQTYLAEHDIMLQAWAPVMRGRAGDVPELVQIAGRHGVTPSQVAIRWILQQGYTAVPKSVHDERILENADVFGFELSDGDMARISDLDKAHRLGRDPDNYAW